MELTKNLKRKAGNYLLTKRLKDFSRERQMYTLQTARTAGIIITLNDQESLELIKKFLNDLTNQNIKVYALAFVDHKKIPESFLLWKGINLFSRKDLNWAGIPKSPEVKDFIDQPFDMLIDLTSDDSFAVQYISTLSRSKFKIGRTGNNAQCFDLMFELKKETPLGEYIENLSRYLDLLNHAN